MDNKKQQAEHQMAADCYRAVRTIERYGKQGFIVSIVFGQCGDKGDLYSVTVIDPTTGREFAEPFVASDFGTIAKILNNEVPAMLAR